MKVQVLSKRVLAQTAPESTRLVRVKIPAVSSHAAGGSSKAVRVLTRNAASLSSNSSSHKRERNAKNMTRGRVKPSSDRDTTGRDGTDSSENEEWRVRMKRATAEESQKRATARKRKYSQLSGEPVLHQLSVTSSTRNKYQELRDEFVSHLGSKGQQLSQDPTVLDNQLSSYFESLFFQGLKPHKGEATMSAILSYQSHLGKRSLPKAWRALKGWKRECPASTRLPWGLEVWSAVINFFVSMRRWDLAMYIAMSISCYLRPSEALRVRKADLVAAQPHFSVGATVVLHPSTRETASKGGLWDEAVTLNRPWLSFLDKALFAYTRRMSRQQLLFNFGYPELLTWVRKLEASLGIEVSPHQLRHSGASIDGMGGLSQEEIRLRGRWQSGKSAMRYQKGGLLGKAGLQLNAAQRLHFTACRAQLESILCHQVALPVPKNLGSATKK